MRRTRKIAIVSTRIVLRNERGCCVLSPSFFLEKEKGKKEEKSQRYPSALNQRQPVAILQERL